VSPAGKLASAEDELRVAAGASKPPIVVRIGEERRVKRVEVIA